MTTSTVLNYLCRGHDVRKLCGLCLWLRHALLTELVFRNRRQISRTSNVKVLRILYICDQMTHVVMITLTGISDALPILIILSSVMIEAGAALLCL